MTTIEYDELTDQFFFACHECGAEGRGWDAERDVGLDADRHDELHDEEG